ncbi:MAG: PilZ domain-containing protein [Myxococcales bacterium]|nr:PilZ domain-containing protein [Myxococcales bacterium]
MTDERRSTERYPVELWVEESSDRELYFQRGANISAGGIFLERTIPHAKGTVINLRFSLPGDPKPIEVKGEIVNVGEDATDLGMGVKFLDLAESDRERIETFIAHAHEHEEDS